MATSSKPRVLVLPERGADGVPYGSSYVRLLLPLTHPLLLRDLDLSVGRAARVEGIDAVIVDRTWQPYATVKEAQDFRVKLRKAGTKLIYSIDDNLLDRHPDPSTERSLRLLRTVVLFFLREADAVLVSTHNLQKRLLHLNPRVWVLPNALDERLLRSRNVAALSPNTRRIRIGYMGTMTHFPDLISVLPGLRNVFRRYSRHIEVEFLGIARNEQVRQLFGPEVKVTRIQAPEAQYPNFLGWMTEQLDWDIAIAPLADSAFNACKSDIKFLDYGICGIAGVYSHGPAYGDTVHHLVTGMLVPNVDSDWADAIARLIEDETMRHRIGAAAKDFVSRNRMLRQNAGQWRDAIVQILEERAPSGVQ